MKAKRKNKEPRHQLRYLFVKTVIVFSPKIKLLSVPDNKTR
jgi:hypothetical protein